MDEGCESRELSSVPLEGRRARARLLVVMVNVNGKEVMLEKSLGMISYTLLIQAKHFKGCDVSDNYGSDAENELQEIFRRGVMWAGVE